MFPSNAALSENLDFSTMPLPLSPMFLNYLAPMLADSPDSGVSSLNSSLTSLLNYISPVVTPVRKERIKRPRADYCNLCRKHICKENKRSQGPSRHILQCHMNIPKFFCPHCATTSNYDKAHITTHMRWMHKGLGGEVRVATDPTYEEKFKKMRALCFGPPEERKKDEVDSKSSGSPPRLSFSIESILASVPPKEEASPSVSSPVLPFQ